MAILNRGYTGELTIEESHHLNEFLLKLLRLSNQRKVSLLYRGDKLENLFSRLGLTYSPTNPDFETLLIRLFTVGEKGRHYYSFELSGAQGRIIRMDEYDEDVFRFIFDHLNRATKNPDASRIQFFASNTKFREYFSDKKNKSVFIANVMKCARSQKLFYRNHYLMLLHQLSAVNYKSKSHFVSLSTSYRIAEHFSKSRKSGQNFIIHAWMPYRIPPKYSSHSLPVYTGSPFGWQKEVSMPAGVLPHFIICLELPGLRTFYNPYLFRTLVEERAFIEGFNVDQRHFNEVIKLTNYNRSFNILGDQFWEEEHQ